MSRLLKLAFATLLFFGIFTFTVHAAIVVNGKVIENFENCPPAGQPSDPHYTFTHGTLPQNQNCGPPNNPNTAGNVSYSITQTGAWGAYTLGTQFCAGVNDFSYWVRDSTAGVTGLPSIIWAPHDLSTALSATDEYYQVSDSPAAGSHVLSLAIHNSAGVTSSPAATLNWPGAASAWYHLAFGCHATSFTMTLIETSGCTCGAPLSTTIGPPFAITMTGNGESYIVLQSSANGFIRVDDLNFGSPGASTFGASATATVVTLRGFDVDPFTNVVLARTDVGVGTTKIRAFQPVTLTEYQNIANGCNRVDGVGAYSQLPQGKFFSAFFDCTSSPTQVDTLSVRDAALNSPDQSGTVCEGENFCDFDMTTQTGSLLSASCQASAAGSPHQLPGNSGQLGLISAFPISWQQGFNPSGAAAKNVFVGYAFEDTGSGNVGVWVIRQVNNNPDVSCSYQVPYQVGGGTVTQICTIHQQNATVNNDYVVAAAANRATTAWQVRLNNLFSSNTGISADNDPPSLNMAQKIALSGNYVGAFGIGCSDTKDLFVLDANGAVSKVDILNQGGHVIWGPNSAFGVARGIHASVNGNWLAYTSSATEVTVANGTTGIPVAIVTMPAGTFKEVRLSRNAQTLYIATDVRIARYDIHTATTGTALCEACNPDGSQVDSNNQVISGPGSSSSPPTNIFSVFGSLGPMILGLMIIAGFVLGAYYLTENSQYRAPFLAFAGIIGYIAAIAIVSFPKWPIVVLAIFAVAFIFLRNRAGAST